MNMRGVLNLRLLPVVIFATAALLVVKVMTLTVGFNFGLGGRPALASSAKPAEPAPASPPPAAQKKPQGINVLENIDSKPASEAERALLERLQSRRQELDTRNRDLDMRENLIKAAEKRLETRLNELKESDENSASSDSKQKELQAQKLKGLVTVYESMKAKDAAQIFDRLDLSLLVDLASAMKPAKLADVIAQMQPEAAEKLTMEMARRNGVVSGGKTAATSPNELPRVEHRK